MHYVKLLMVACQLFTTCPAPAKVAVQANVVDAGKYLVDGLKDGFNSIVSGVSSWWAKVTR